jgi:hypothetical protein
MMFRSPLMFRVVLWSTLLIGPVLCALASRPFRGSGQPGGRESE